MSDTPCISIVMGSYNQCETLRLVLEAYNTQQTNLGFEVIVVDSSSTDGTIEMLESFKADYMLRPIIQENTGKASARNRGVQESVSDLIVITDSDMIPESGFVSAHFDAHDMSEKPTCFEGVTYNLHRLEFPCEQDNCYPYIQEKIKHGQKLGWYYFLTGNISFPKALFNTFGGFDDSFKSYGWEDLELGYRMSLKKVPLRYLSNAKNYHYHVISKGEEIERCIAKGDSAKRLIAKHPKLKWFLGLNPLSVFLFKRLAWEGRVVSFFRRCYAAKAGGLRHRVGFWFLKEHYYLRGLLGAGE